MSSDIGLLDEIEFEDIDLCDFNFDKQRGSLLFPEGE